MARKMIGGILLGVGGLGIIVLLTYGGPVFPHIFGPGVIAILGVVLLFFKKRSR
jgi:hypothetical protein